MSLARQSRNSPLPNRAKISGVGNPVSEPVPKVFMAFHGVARSAPLRSDGVVRMAGASAQPIPRVSARCASCRRHASSVTHQSGRAVAGRRTSCDATGGGPILADDGVMPEACFQHDAILVHSLGYGLRYARRVEDATTGDVLDSS